MTNQNERCTHCEGKLKAAISEAGEPTWKCLNCYRESTRRTRKASAKEAARKAALDALFNRLTGESTCR